MRLEIVHLPQPVHCGFADFLLLRHEPTTPMRHPLGLSLQSGFDDGVSPGLVVARFASASGCNLPNLADAHCSSCAWSLGLSRMGKLGLRMKELYHNPKHT